MYEYKCTLVRVIDGDTVVVDIDLGLSVHHIVPVRLYGINAPEIRTEQGPVAKKFVEDWFVNKLYLIRTIKDKTEKYGRYLGVFVDVDTGITLNSALVEAGLAVIYYG